METSINIGFECSLLRQEMNQIIISLETPKIRELEKEGNKNVVFKAWKEAVIHQINEDIKLLTSSSTEAFALIIDGKSLAYALEDNVKDLFLQLAVACASVISCHSSPKEKALVTRLVKFRTRKVTLAIGDGPMTSACIKKQLLGLESMVLKECRYITSSTRTSRSVLPSSCLKYMCHSQGNLHITIGSYLSLISSSPYFL